MSETLVQLKQGLGFLATIGSTAPFVGLFGTVAGIINAFRNIAATGSGGMSVVSGGIAEALVTTALGIFVAIPAVAAFNYFTGRIENFHIEMNRASTQLVNRLFKSPQIDRVANAARRRGAGAADHLYGDGAADAERAGGPLAENGEAEPAGRRKRPDSGLHR
jgi:hypothetical protein